MANIAKHYGISTFALTLKGWVVLTIGVIRWLLQWKEQQDQSVNAGNHEVTNTH